jgi:hypothetical protein
MLWRRELFVGVAIITLAGCCVALIGLARPKTIRPLFIFMMIITHPIGLLLSNLILLGFYYVVLTPIGFLMRLMKYDPLKREYDHSAGTYWVKHNKPDDIMQYFKQY